jgi:hypothetical protein
MNTPLAPPDIGRVTKSACPPRRQKETLAEQVKTFLGDRFKDHDGATLDQHEAEFGKFRAWARSYGHRALPAPGPVVAAYLMAIMSDVGCLNRVLQAAGSISAVHAARGRYLDMRYVKAAIAWAKEFRAGAELL